MNFPYQFNKGLHHARLKPNLNSYVDVAGRFRILCNVLRRL